MELSSFFTPIYIHTKYRFLLPKQKKLLLPLDFNPTVKKLPARCAALLPKTRMLAQRSELGRWIFFCLPNIETTRLLLSLPPMRCVSSADKKKKIPRGADRTVGPSHGSFVHFLGCIVIERNVGPHMIPSFPGLQKLSVGRFMPKLLFTPPKISFYTFIFFQFI